MILKDKARVYWFSYNTSLSWYLDKKFLQSNREIPLFDWALVIDGKKFCVDLKKSGLREDEVEEILTRFRTAIKRGWLVYQNTNIQQVLAVKPEDIKTA